MVDWCSGITSRLGAQLGGGVIVCTVVKRAERSYYDEIRRCYSVSELAQEMLLLASYASQ